VIAGTGLLSGTPSLEGFSKAMTYKGVLLLHQNRGWGVFAPLPAGGTGSTELEIVP
jgi:hypothetical protein